MASSFQEFLKSFLLMIGYILLHILIFAITTSICIGLSLLLVFTIEAWFSALSQKTLQVPQYIVLCATLFILFDAARFVVFCSNSCRFRRRMKELKKKHPIALGCVPSMLYFTIICLAFVQLSQQYEVTHVELESSEQTPVNELEKTKNHNKKSHTKSNKTETTFYPDDYTMNVTIFVFCLAALVFIVGKILHRDLINKFKGVPVNRDGDFCRTTLSFLVAQTAVTIGYSLPVLYVLLVLIVFEYTESTLFYQTNLAGILVGICVGILETRNPFPIQVNQPPSYAFENQARARVLLLQLGLLPLIPYFFFLPGTTQEFDPSDPTFLKFTLTVAVTVLHIVKILTIQYIFNERRRRQDRERIEKFRRWILRNFRRNSNTAVTVSATSVHQQGLDLEVVIEGEDAPVIPQRTTNSDASIFSQPYRQIYPSPPDSNHADINRNCEAPNNCKNNNIPLVESPRIQVQIISVEQIQTQESPTFQTETEVIFSTNSSPKNEASTSN